MKPSPRAAAHWNARQDAAADDRELAYVWIDRARSLAAKAEKGGDTHAWYSLVEALHDWCSRFTP